MPNIITNKGEVTYKSNQIKSNEVVINLPPNMQPKIKKKANKTSVSVGDTIKYTIEITGRDNTVSSYPFSDTLDTDTEYIAGTFKVDGTAQTPTATSPTITYTLTIPADTTVVVEFDVLVL